MADHSQCVTCHGTAHTDIRMVNNNILEQQTSIEDQVDYQFIQRVVQELTQSCALPVPIPASAIPPLILLAAQFFWDNDDQAVEERYYGIHNSDIQQCGNNKVIKLPPQIISVFGCYKLTDNFTYGAMGDFSLERMVFNNSALSIGTGGTMSNVWGNGLSTGYNLQDVMGALYEVQTYKAMFEHPLTYNYNQFSNDLVLMGELGHSDLLLQCYKRVKIQDLYKSYYFFRYVICLAKRAMQTIMGTFDFKLPGGVVLNHSAFRDQADAEIQEIIEWINNNHSVDYFFCSNTI